MRFSVSIIATLLVWTLQDASAAKDRPLWKELPAKEASVSLDGPVNASSFSALADELSPTVVFITVDQKTAPRSSRFGAPDMGRPFFPFFDMPDQAPQRRSSGSGFVIREDGYIVTNHHVVTNARQVLVRLDTDEEFEAVVVGEDPATDLALLKIETSRTLPVAPLGNSDDLRIGHWVLAIGNPFGLDHSVTAGIVSAKGRKDVAPSGGPIYANFIQTDASINPGNSGGPLINMRGEVIGINTAIVAAGQGIGFAIPVNMAKQLLPQLATGRVQRSYLGVIIQDISREMAKALSLPTTKGALVSSVERGSPAATAGIEAGDVVVSFDGKNVDSRADLSWLASIAGIGKVARVEIIREGTKRSVDVTLARHPQFGGEPTKTESSKDQPSNVQGLGIRVEDVPDELRQAEGLKADVGAYVAAVERKGSGARAGLRPGDIVLRVGYKTVNSPAHFRSLVEQIPVDATFSLLVLRKGTATWIAVTTSQP